jgi:tRNA A-37 threonylcarbamoyl transferase component Bud32
VAADVAGALAYLHGRGVMHGDLTSRWVAGSKPQELADTSVCCI